MNQRTPPALPSEQRLGRIYAWAAFLTWGVLPIYWATLKEVPKLEVIAHRTVWSFVLLILIVHQRGKLSELRSLLAYRRAIGLFSLTGLLIGGNWLIYVFAMHSGYMLEASLGYFMSPLLNVALGLAFLRERLSVRGWISVALAAMGVAIFAGQASGLPWVALSLSGTFCVYALIRKKFKADALVASCFEMMLMSVPAVLYFVYLAIFTPARFVSLQVFALLPMSGVVTGLPFLWYALAAQRLPLSSVGMLQYVAPSLQFLIAVFIYDEALTSVHLQAFGFIWAGLAVYSSTWIQDRFVTAVPRSKALFGLFQTKV